jgi:hypothetical protein
MMNFIYRLFPYVPFIVIAVAILVAIYHIRFYW